MGGEGVREWGGSWPTRRQVVGLGGSAADGELDAGSTCGEEQQQVAGVLGMTTVSAW